MAGDANTERISELTSRYVSDNVRLWQRYAEGLRRASEGAMPRAQTGGQPAAFPGDVPMVAQQLVQLNLTHYSELLNTYADFANNILRTVLQPQGSAAAAATPPPPVPQAAGGARLELVFEGAIGETVSQPFAVANKKSESIDVAFELTEFVAEDGGARFRAPVMFVPDRFVLQPGAERIVECRIPLVAAFAPGTRYMALVRVTGFPPLDTALIVVPHAGRQPVREGELVESAPVVDATVVVASASSESKAAHARTKPAASRAKRRHRKTQTRTP